MAAPFRCRATVTAKRRSASCSAPRVVMIAASSNWRRVWRRRSMFDLTFTIETKDGTTPLTLAIDQAVIAGWTGRARQAHRGARGDRDRATGFDADLLPLLGAAAD